MKPLRLWPQRLVGQVTLVLMLAVALEFIGSSILFENSRLYPNRDNQVRRAAEQLVTAENAPGKRAPSRALRPRRLSLSTRATSSPGRTCPPWSTASDRPSTSSRTSSAPPSPACAAETCASTELDRALPRDTHLKVALKLRDGTG
jgi:two-component system osmolarity sensor histidine kinase EnvZ